MKEIWEVYRMGIGNVEWRMKVASEAIENIQLCSYGSVAWNYGIMRIWRMGIGPTSLQMVPSAPCTFSQLTLLR